MSCPGLATRQNKPDGLSPPGRLFVLFLILITLATACESRESYMREIGRKGITFSAESFLSAASAGKKDTVELFLKAGMDINARGKKRETALMLVAANRDIELMKFLVGRGADVNAQNSDSYSALMFISSLGYPEVAKFLIGKGADMNAKNSNGETALMLAVLHDNLDVTKVLIDKGADVHARDNKGRKAIDYAFLNKQMKDLLRKAMREK